MCSIKNIILHPLAVILFFSLSLVGCGQKRIDGINSSWNSAGLNHGPSGSGQDFIVNVGDRVFFSLDSSSIEPDAQRVLMRQAEWLLRYPYYFITIEGHADERGTREYNLALGQRRAVAVRDYLISLGVSAQRLQTISYGKERPVAVCDDISCWNQNRRAVTTIQNVNGE
ncbi:peptidoglycan-associated lipoprotein Pal [Bartonella doshiae]|uniref:Peptidoglycan-associated lipoprotein n=2 Tax=Bartonella doshiae TaxID=33044 RepID=A0A380ZGD7_BARDO|nr:peptidoglycan-associated lipoprotein Pal [Bartonella doshiae]EJF80029.1 peptidoglycan-associated lipoprotein [Bartonella doshiae NCTC 12862 = ATCC 700133]MBB6158884.1 peptidoglycan-associated lipoprotein [Bartonella doshiae]SUV45630.1 Minor outer membrane protein Omp16 [Bartonella doshiae]